MSTIWLEILPRKIYWEHEKNWESIRVWVSYHKGVDRHYVGTREIFLESEDLTIEGSNTYVNTVNSVSPEIAHCKEKGWRCSHIPQGEETVGTMLC